MYKICTTLLIVLFITTSIVSATPIKERWLKKTQKEIEEFYSPFQSSNELVAYFFQYIEGDILSDKIDATIAYLGDQIFLRKRFPETFSFEILEKVLSVLETLPLNGKTSEVYAVAISDLLNNGSWLLTSDQKQLVHNRIFDRLLQETDSDSLDSIETAFYLLAGELPPETVRFLVQKYMNLEKLRKSEWIYIRNIPQHYYRKGLSRDDPYGEEKAVKKYRKHLSHEHQKTICQIIGCCHVLCWDFTPEIEKEVTPIIKEMIEEKMLFYEDAEIVLITFQSGIPDKKREFVLP